MAIEALRLEADKAVGNGLESGAHGVEMLEAFLQTKVAQIIGANVIAPFCSSTSASAVPLANSRFHHTPDPVHAPDSKLEGAYHKAGQAIQNIVDLLAAA